MPSPVVTDPFTIGVSSGDPLADSVILWTRLVPADPLPAEDVDVEWEVATDPDMQDVVASGVGTAPAALGHSVHVDVRGLEPDTEYHYRFRAADFETEPARTRTFASPGTTPERFRFAFSSCQNWEQGYYTAYRDLIEQEDVDAFVFLGDYIYEYASGGYADPRGRADRAGLRVRDGRSVPGALRAVPLRSAAAGRARGTCRGSSRGTTTRSTTTMPAPRARATMPSTRSSPAGPPAYQVWYEHMPVRLDPPDGAGLPHLPVVRPR